METITPEKLAWLRLSLTEGVGPLTFWRLINQGISGEEACRRYDHMAQKGQSSPLSPPTAVHQHIRKMEALQGTMVFFFEEAYPPLLRTLSDPPPVLYCLGNTALLSAPSLAIVGGRNASLIGQNFAKTMGNRLSQGGLTIISGLARGIDQAAHQGALTQEGRSIGVLAGGVDVVYPLENLELYRHMKEEGLLLSEMPPQTPPTAKLFPKRNRIISGLSQGTIVIEASLKSGSLITARCALEQNREVMAVPGFPADSRHHGCNQLIRQGAALVESADDVLIHMGEVSSFERQLPLFPSAPGDDLTQGKAILSAPLEALPHHDNPHYTHVLSCLGPTPLPMESLIPKTGLPCGEMNAILGELEVLGQIKRLPGGCISRTY